MTAIIQVGEDQTTDGLSSDKMYAMDLADEGKLTFQVDTEATKAPLLERTGLDLDEAGRRFLVVSPFSRKRRTHLTHDEHQFGASDSHNTLHRIDHGLRRVCHKIDSRAAGRYLSFKVTLTPMTTKTSSGQGWTLTSPRLSKVMAPNDKTDQLVTKYVGDSSLNWKRASDAISATNSNASSSRS